MTNNTFITAEAAQNYLDNTRMSLMIKLITGGGSALTLLLISIVEQFIILPYPFNQIAEGIYFTIGLCGLILGGGAVRTIKIAWSVFQWAAILTPFYLFDLLIAICAGAMVLAIGVLFPFVPVGMELISLLAKRQEAKLYLK